MGHTDTYNINRRQYISVLDGVPLKGQMNYIVRHDFMLYKVWCSDKTPLLSKWLL